MDKQLLMELLENESWAPFHSSQEPWQLILFREEGRQQFARAMRAVVTKEILEKSGERFQDQYCRAISAHLHVVIPIDPRQKEWVDAFSAAAAFIQNFQLLAWEKNIGVVWKTNEYNWNPKFHKAIGIK